MVRVLENISAPSCHITDRLSCSVLAKEKYLSFSRTEKSVEMTDDGGFSGSILSDYGHLVIFIDLEVNSFKSLNPSIRVNVDQIFGLYSNISFHPHLPLSLIIRERSLCLFQCDRRYIANQLFGER